MNVVRRLRSVLLATLAAFPLLSPHPTTPAAAQARRGKPTAAATNAACLARALGGMESVARFSTIYTRYRFEVGGLEGTDTFWRDVRGAFREHLEVPGAGSEQTVFDGAKGWRQDSTGVVTPLTGVMLERQVTEAYLGSFMHIVPGRIPGKVERVGLDRASGLVRLRVLPQGGTPATLFLDTLTCLPARIDVGAGDARATFHLTDWRAVSGIRLPHSIRRTQGDTARDARMTLLEARFDAPLPSGVFTKPSPAKAEAPPAR